MSKLSNFIITEQLKTRHIVTLHRFKELFKEQVTLDLRERLAIAWGKLISKASLRASAQDEAEILVVRPKAIVNPTVIKAPFKLRSTSELGRKHEASPALLLPGRYSTEQRDLLIDGALTSAAACLKTLIKSWPEVFSRDVNGQLKTDFTVVRSKSSVKLIMSTKVGEVESHETIVYYIAVEHGLASSKIRDFTTVYLGVGI